MKTLFVTASAFVFLLLGSMFVQTTFNITYAEEETRGCNCHEHHFISKEEVKRLTEQGYSKKEIFTAAHIAKFADKNIEDVLKTYKENGSSWAKTTEHYGFNMEKLKKSYHEEKESFLAANKETVIENVAEYSGKTEDEIEGWVDKGISLRFIVGAASLAKASNKDLAEIIKLKEEGQTYKDIRKSFNPDKKQLHEEMHTLMRKIKDDIID